MFHPHSPKDINHFLPSHYSIWCFILNTFSVSGGTFPVQRDVKLTIEELYTVLSDLLGNVLIITVQHLTPCWDIWHSSIRRYYTTWIQPLCFILPLNLCLSNCQRQTSNVKAGEDAGTPLYWSYKTEELGQQDLKGLKKTYSTYDV